MPIQPSDAAATLASERDHVAGEVFGVTYSDLSSAIQTRFDQEGDNAAYEYAQIAKWYTEIDPSTEDVPAIWNELFVEMWIAKAKGHFKSSQDGHVHWTQNVVPLFQRLADHFSNNWDSSSFQGNDAITLEQFRWSVIGHLVRQRTPVMPPVNEIDRTIREEFVKLWNERGWNFRKRPVKLTLNTDGTIDADAAYDFDGFASRHMEIQTTTGTNRTLRVPVIWLDSSRFARASAALAGTTGRPRYFHDFDQGATKKIQLLPLPDKAYTAYSEIFIGAPDFGAVGAATGLAQMPKEFKSYLRLKVIARLMNLWGREDNDANRVMKECKREHDELLDNFDDKGASRYTARPDNFTRWTDAMIHGSRVLGQM